MAPPLFRRLSARLVPGVWPGNWPGNWPGDWPGIWPAFVAAAALTLSSSPALSIDDYAEPDHVIADIFEAAASDAPTAVSVLMDRGDVRRYRAIFDLQSRGRLAVADQIIGRLSDRRLMGHVLFQRYMHPEADNGADEVDYPALAGWLGRYGDHPGATRLHRLAEERRGDHPAPSTPDSGGRLWGTVEAFGVEACEIPPESGIERNARRHVLDLVGRTRPTAALEWLVRPDHAAVLSQTVRDRARADIAAGYLHAGYPRRALTEAVRAAEQSGEQAPRGLWIAGLSAWELNDRQSAGEWFRQLASAACANAWQRTAGAFWAARAHDAQDDPQGREQWLAVAASYPYTFYGIVARRMLGLDTPFSFDSPDLSGTHLALVNATPRGHRAIGLLQVGLTDLAARELSTLVAQSPSGAVRDGVVAIAQESQLAALSLYLGGAVTPEEEALFDGALYPIPAWDPPGGYYIDRALILATMRQESRFDPDAVSHAGATGLMQLMPATADAMARRHLDMSTHAAGNLELTDPGLNVGLGQAYFRQLMATDRIGDDLIGMIAGYNAGPGNLRRWQAAFEGGNDPFLFIERIPVRETRNYVKQVLSNFWIYRSRLGQPSPSLDAIARFDRPRYSGLDTTVTEVAADHGAN
ncbi:lytic transglycosylase domain-containing protein [Fodinicurvata sp. EGI_FJ10296]|uniref:lytic transglycosylase domain-containing protein n=1 Tax=Fodinicurvata sp. EGI_FJ10296 TaxID=3231908 RepID=UPI003455688A